MLSSHPWLSLIQSDAADDLIGVDLGGRRIIKKKKLVTKVKQHVSITSHD